VISIGTGLTSTLLSSQTTNTHRETASLLRRSLGAFNTVERSGRFRKIRDSQEIRLHRPNTAALTLTG
ncbi:hypothetical protein ACFPIJ_21725, partial [Dactylosporangium cerinum]